MNYPFHKTQQFSSVVYQQRENAKFHNRKPEILDYIGTVKLHGTNASIVAHEDGSITLHSKSSILCVIDPAGNVTRKSENAAFGFFMSANPELKDVVAKAVAISGGVWPVKISGEWCGQGIQRGVGISYLPRKTLFIFGVKAGSNWLPLTSIKDVRSSTIRNIMEFPTKEITIDFALPELSQNALVDATNAVERECPVAKAYGIEDCHTGEGLVWQPKHDNSSSGSWFKTKGTKHSVTKTKSVVPVDLERLKSIQEFVEYACTENRMEQLFIPELGEFIRAVIKDITDEESETLKENGFTARDFGKYAALKAKDYFASRL